MENIILNFIEEKLIKLESKQEEFYPGCDMSFSNEEEWKKKIIGIKANIELLLELKSLNINNDDCPDCTYFVGLNIKQVVNACEKHSIDNFDIELKRR